MRPIQINRANEYQVSFKLGMIGKEKIGLVSNHGCHLRYNSELISLRN